MTLFLGICNPDCCRLLQNMPAMKLPLNCTSIHVHYDSVSALTFLSEALFLVFVVGLPVVVSPVFVFPHFSFLLIRGMEPCEQWLWCQLKSTSDGHFFCLWLIYNMSVFCGFFANFLVLDFASPIKKHVWHEQQPLNSIVMLHLIFLVFSVIHTEDALNIEHQNEASFLISCCCVMGVWTSLN